MRLSVLKLSEVQVFFSPGRKHTNFNPSEINHSLSKKTKEEKKEADREKERHDCVLPTSVSCVI